MRTFRSTMIEIDSGGQAVVRAPVEFSGRVSEARLEAWLIEHPELAGEPLLVLGSQLAEFAEDKDRLDVLAVDDQGELVLLELKVDGSFRLTDLQALAYAGAYASMPTSHYVDTLRRHLERHEHLKISAEDAQARIADFIGLDSFEEWEPSQRVRIKLLAPGFPQRVLKTVKWLGDVYAMPIEAIEVKLFEDSAKALHLTVERLLPLSGDDAFDMTVRESAERQQAKNITRRPAVLTALLANGALKDGQTLYLHREAMPAEIRNDFDPQNPVFAVRLDASGSAPRIRWRASPSDADQVSPPSEAWHPILDHLFPGKYVRRGWSVHNLYSVDPGGLTLGELAEQVGAWDTGTSS